jgi:hypothetical protein
MSIQLPESEITLALKSADTHPLVRRGHRTPANHQRALTGAQGAPLSALPSGERWWASGLDCAQESSTMLRYM